jgi:transcriptional regulator with XRE-family HTH domain
MIKKVGDRIRSIRESKNLTQANMGEELDMHESGYAKIERGDVNTPLNRLFQIAEVLDVEITQFFEDKTTQVREPKANYGYATKEELEQVTYVILKEIEELRKELSSNQKTTTVKKVGKAKR